MRLLLWHVHGSWTDAFIHGDHEYLLPVVEDSRANGSGRAGRDWPANVIEVTADRIPDEHVDAAILQRPGELALLQDWLGPRATELPTVYLEHNTPGGPAATTRHPLADRDDIVLVHVTHFNRLMWDVGTTRTVVIPHGIPDPGYRYTGELERQAVLINEAGRRGRAVGADLLPRLAESAPIDLYGIDCDQFGVPGVTGAGDLGLEELHTDMAKRRLYLHTSRWTSLGLSLLEAMHLGMPVVVVGTTEAPVAVPPTAGFVSCDIDELADAARVLIKDPQLATTMGRAAREHALEQYGLPAFLGRWDQLLTEITAGA
jgi:hypothetical protein